MGGRRGAVLAAVGGYVALGFAGAVTPLPGTPRPNSSFTTVTWSQTESGGRAVFRTITVTPSGDYAERFKEIPGVATPRGHRGAVAPAQLERIRRLATSRELTAEARWSRLVAPRACQDTAGIAIRMGGLRIGARDCGRITADALPTFYALSREFIELASDAQPPIGA